MTGEAVANVGTDGLVRIHGELWQAESPSKL